MAGTTLDDYSDRYANRMRGMKASEIRALFSVASRPEIVSLAGGMPYTAALDLEHIAELTAKVVSERGATALQYGAGRGELKLREFICEVMADEGITASANDIVVTVGSQQALSLLAQVFLDPGDIVVAEGPCYVGALGVFSAAQAEVVHVSMDDEGLNPAALAETLAKLRASGQRVKFLYTVPTFNNPAGVTMPDQRRDEIVALAEQHDLLVIEDNPYGLLGFEDPPRRALRARNADRVIYLGSFSKTFAAGLRTGWVLAPHAVKEKLVLMTEAQVLSPSMFTQGIVTAYLEEYPWREQLKAFCTLYSQRRDAMLDALTTSMPAGVSWTKPRGGFFVWLKLPEGIDSKVMLPRALAAGVAYVPGIGFYSNGEGGGQLRLSYCFPEPERIREGVRRFSTALNDELEVNDVFGRHSKSTVDKRAFVRRDAPGPEVM